MKNFIIIALTLCTFLPAVFARGVRSFGMPQLMSEAHLAFVGKVKSVKRSGLTTALTYPTWKGTTFEWLKVEIEVVEALKGTKKGASVRTMLLSSPDGGPMINPPGMVEVKVGQHLLMFLHPTEKKDIYASMSAPWDDDQAIFVLDRKHAELNLTSIYLMKLIPKLVNKNGAPTRKGIENLRKEFQKQLALPGPKDALIHLKWKTRTSKEGWEWDTPDTQKKTDQKPVGPVSR